MQTTLSEAQMFAAMETCDHHFDGVFFVGVKTTKIYCLPSCKAKLPLRKNVLFFKTEQDAQNADLRACLRCKPDLFPDITPKWVSVCRSFLKETTERRVGDAELAAMAGVDVSTLRRIFTAELGKSAAHYHRDIRLDHAAAMLRGKRSILQVSEETGFESLSGFNDAFRKRFGVSPGGYQNG